MQHNRETVPLSLRVSLDVRDQLEELSDATGRTKSFLAAEAIKFYLNAQLWQIKAIQEAVHHADSANAKFIDHQKVSDWLNNWGNEDEQDLPE